VVQLAEDDSPEELEPPPAIREAKVESFFFTAWLPQAGQIISAVALALRTSSSKGFPQSWQINSKMGIASITFVGMPAQAFYGKKIDRTAMNG
jgi:hypothetical protein